MLDRILAGVDRQLAYKLMLYTMIETLNSSSSNDGSKNSTNQEPSNSTTSHVK